jgi:ribosomal-protein-alanine N-acetyltransferase
MSKADVIFVHAIEQIAYEYPWSLQNLHNCVRAGYQCWVWQLNSNIIGYGIMSIAGGECEILNLCVHPNYQRQGLGRDMLLHLLNIGQQHGADTAFLEVREANTIALQLYRQVGFNEIGIRRNYYPCSTGRMNAIMLAKVLL